LSRCRLRLKIGGHISDLQGRFLQSLIREARPQTIRGEYVRAQLTRRRRDFALTRLSPDLCFPPPASGSASRAGWQGWQPPRRTAWSP
jgi:hypothetical protein